MAQRTAQGGLAGAWRAQEEEQEAARSPHGARKRFKKRAPRRVELEDLLQKPGRMAPRSFGASGSGCTLPRKELGSVNAPQLPTYVLEVQRLRRMAVEESGCGSA